jgi:hypothetical protein
VEGEARDPSGGGLEFGIVGAGDDVVGSAQDSTGIAVALLGQISQIFDEAGDRHSLRS